MNLSHLELKIMSYLVQIFEIYYLMAPSIFLSYQKHWAKKLTLHGSVS